MYFHTVGDVEITADVNKRENIFLHRTVHIYRQTFKYDTITTR